jgi:hypothetical protein
MRKKWQLKKGADTLVVVRRADIFPQEITAVAPRPSAVDFDRWLSDPGSRPVMLELYEAIGGRAPLDLKNANLSELQRSVKPRLQQAFQSRELVGVLIPRTFMTQAPMEAAEEAAQATARAARAAPSPAPRQTTWIGIQLLDERGRPMAKEHYRIELPDGSIIDGTLDPQGCARHDGIDPGTCFVTFPDLKVTTLHRS